MSRLSSSIPLSTKGKRGRGGFVLSRSISGRRGGGGGGGSRNFAVSLGRKGEMETQGRRSNGSCGWCSCFGTRGNTGDGSTSMYIPYHDYNPDRYEPIFLEKVKEIEKNFSEILTKDDCKIQWHTSPPTHFRLRCRFAMTKTKKGRLSYTLFDGGEPRIKVDSFPIACLQINR